jgi:hypothetical protein
MFAALLVSLLFPGQANAVPEADLAKQQQAKWNALYAKTAAEYEITLGQEGKKRLQLEPESVLHWSNPVRGGETNGSVFVWTYDGRAEAVGTIFSHLVRDDPGQKVTAHSFQSLSQQPLAGQRPGRPGAWSLDGAGVSSQKIPGAPAPGRSRAARLAQMRELVRDFSATTTLEGVEQELRLLTQPLHRNEKSTEDVLDGALFTFVTGTDPELMLVIEARAGAGADDPTWHYAAGRFTDLTLKLRHKDVELWTHERGASRNGRPDPYISGRYEMMPRLLP